MTAPEPFERLEAELRFAVASGDYASAAKVWELYASRLRDCIAPDSISAERLKNTRRLIDWTLQMCAAARAAAIEERGALEMSLRYFNVSHAENPIIRVKA